MSAEDKELGKLLTREDTTEEFSFDELAKGLASGKISRGRALKLVGAAILGGGVLAFGPTREAEAAECGSDAGCNNQCNNTTRCRCVRTTSGNVTCVRPCCSQRRCDNNSQCGENEVCMTTQCCSESTATRGVCVRRCRAPRPNYCDRERF
jgi:hypothetical protein